MDIVLHYAEARCRPHVPHMGANVPAFSSYLGTVFPGIWNGARFPDRGYAGGAIYDLCGAGSCYARHCNYILFQHIVYVLYVEILRSIHR